MDEDDDFSDALTGIAAPTTILWGDRDGFASRADAQAFCDRLKAAGKACFVR